MPIHHSPLWLYLHTEDCNSQLKNCPQTAVVTRPAHMMAESIQEIWRG